MVCTDSAVYYPVCLGRPTYLPEICYGFDSLASPMSRLKKRNYKRLVDLEDERGMQERDAILKIKRTSKFHDITADIPGTAPEKIVYNYLVKLKVNFKFQYHYPENWDTSNQESLWIPDFILPDYNNSFIEVYGTYWHTMKRDSDQLKKAYWLMDGYTIVEQGVPMFPSNKTNGGKAIIWWESEIYRGIDFLFSRDLPEIFMSHVKGAAAPGVEDIDKEFLKIKSMRASIAARKRKPKYVPPVSRIKKLKRRIYE